MRNAHLLLVPMGFFCMIGCSSKPAPPRETTLSGSAALATFPNSPTSIRVTDETGRAVTAPTASDGSFSLTLARGHTYKAVLVGQGDVPLVFPRKTGALDTTFLLKTDGANIALGSVHYLPEAPTGGFRVMSSQQGSGGKGDTETEVDDDESASCDDGSKGSSGDDNEIDTSDNRADGAREMAVAEHNAPNEVAGCDREDESESESKD
jgi:hypothetical protein